MESYPARLHVLLAREAPTGVIIRRGPSKRVCTVLWDRARDEFRVGQWLKGRVFERRSDLSPDGKRLIYFAMNGRWESETRGSWTAISRAPYLKALALFSKGDCWNGGGLFTGNDSYWLNDASGHSVLRDTGELRRDRKFRPSGGLGSECLGVYYPRLLRDGWRFVRRVKTGWWTGRDVFEKPIGGGWLLRKVAHAGINEPPGKGCYWDEHELVHPEREAPVRRPGWEWADLDGERLVWAEGGKLFAGFVSADGLGGELELFDFNEMAFEAIEAPY
jgi:hypothetical protein